LTSTTGIMASFDRAFSSAPVLTMPPQHAHHAPFDESAFPQSSQSFTNSSWSQTPRQVYAIAGRKRSRDEAAVNLDAPEKLIPQPIKETEEEWVFGEGMTLVKPGSGYVAEAGSQSGTWVEEQAAIEAAQKAEADQLVQEQLSQTRPSLRSNKSQRLQASDSFAPDQLDPLTRSSPTRDITNPLVASAPSPAQPVIDDFTVHLGIGWSRISDDENMQAAARGWAKFIENHFAISDAKIRLQSLGLQSYLVEANEGYFLFAENLRHGQLVSKDPERALQNLKTSPPIFDGPEPMQATETPKPLETIVELTDTTMDLS
jgi:hypothetical protein